MTDGAWEVSDGWRTMNNSVLSQTVWGAAYQAAKPVPWRKVALEALGKKTVAALRYTAFPGSPASVAPGTPGLGMYSLRLECPFWTGPVL